MVEVELNGTNMCFHITSVNTDAIIHSVSHAAYFFIKCLL